MRSFWALLGAATVRSFSSVNQIKFTVAAGYRLSSFRQQSRRTFLLASVNSWTLRFLWHFSCKLFLMILLTDVRDIPTCLAICLCEEWDCGASSWLNTRSSTWSMTSSVRAHLDQPLPGLWWISPIISILRIRWFSPSSVHCFSGNIFNNCLAL